MKLVKILSDSVQIRTNLSEFKNIRINDLLSVSDGWVELVTMVTGLMDTDSEERIGEDDFLGEITGIKTIDCTIIGSLKNGRFVKAIDEYPTTSVQITPISGMEFQAMLGNDSRGFRIGTYAAYECDAVVDGNKFFQRHACIVGNTGCGKSETVAKILEETAKLPGANLVVFDIHGEYSQLSYASNIKIGALNPFPIWMFGFNDIVTNILKIREETATTVMMALRKCYYKVCKKGSENKPVYFDYNRLIAEMEHLDEQVIPTGEYYKTGDRAGTQKTTKGEYNGKLTGTINMLKDRMMDSRYRFLFDDELLQSYLYEFMDDVLSTRKPVKNIDLSGVPHDVALPIIGVISRLIFDIQRQQDMDHIRPVTIVCDEAHVYIPDNFQLSASQRRMVEVFEDIAKEGRKFGITLFPATQRPSELNKTIVAQCANFIIGKLNNENDKSLIKGMLPDGDDKIIDAVTMFNPGEVLIVGDAVPIPLKIKVELANERPISRTIEFWDVWSQETDCSVTELVDRYL